jgi:hypothetical protein
VRSSLRFACLLTVASAACASKPAAAPTAEAAPANASTAATGKSTPVESESEAPDPGDNKLPSACADPKSAVCAPSGAFVERLCTKPRQDIALGLFSPSTPFTRVYLRGKLDELVLDEEVLVLRFHAPQKNGIIVGNGGGTYDVLRWDGSCSTGVEAEMVTRTRPGRPRTAHVQWHRIATPVQDALISSSEAVKRAHARRGKECKGAMSGDVSAACEKADDALVAAVVEFVRSGGSLPISGLTAND